MNRSLMTLSRENFMSSDPTPLSGHPCAALLSGILASPTLITSAGFDALHEKEFNLFLAGVPHLFRDGRLLLDLFEALEQAPPGRNREEEDNARRAVNVLGTVVRTAAITAPTDLWLLRLVLDTLRRLPVLEELQGRTSLDALVRGTGLDRDRLKTDLDLLASRGILQGEVRGDRSISLAPGPHITALCRSLSPWPAGAPVNMVPPLVSWLQSGAEKDLAESFLRMDEHAVASPCWIPGRYEVEAGSRLVPLVLSMKSCGLLDDARRGGAFAFTPGTDGPVSRLLGLCGLLDEEGRITALGERVFQRGPGPFGIIHAYHPYLTHHTELLQGKGQVHVSRGENVAASRDANTRSFRKAMDSLDRYCADTGFQYEVFIEHAVGQAEATRIRYERSGDDLHYFGADLEDAAIDRALEVQSRGLLPGHMRFVRQADIGDPQILIRALADAGLQGKNAVMVVGNGFHEVRGQNNENMVRVFRAYREAGILLIFTEESSLTDAELLATGWNTYHAGFRYVHELSGQGLRPAGDGPDDRGRLSWKACVEKAGYKVAAGYTTQGRTIFPFRHKGRKNPAISVNYFCVP